MSNVGEEIRYRGVRKRKWGKYVAEIRSGKRARISLGSYFTPHAAARAYDTALLCLRGPHATSFNFPDSHLNLTALQMANSNPSPLDIRQTAITFASSFDIVPANCNPSNDANIEAAGGSGKKEEDAISNEEHSVVEETSELNDLLRSPEHITFEESIPMPVLHPHHHEMIQPYDQADLCSDLAILNVTTSQASRKSSP